MIKSAYTARELAEMKLPGFPESQQGLNYIAKKGEWTSRPRQAVGGGVEYPFATLPAELKKAILNLDSAGVDALKNPLAGLEEAAAGIGAEDRRTAKLAVVAMYGQYRRVTGLGVIQAELPFQAHYRQQAASTPKDMPYNVYADFSIPSLRRWRVMAEADPKALAGNYGTRKGTGILYRANNGEVCKYIAALMLENSHYKAGHIRDLCRSRFSEQLEAHGKQVPLPSLRAFERHMVEWKQNNHHLFVAVTAPGQFKNHIRVATGDASAHIEYMNQQWQIDASPSDALCIDGRYSIYAIIDVWSRRSLFLVSKTAKTEASLLLVRKAIMEWGIPQSIKTDNGADFISKRFKTALLSLQIDHEISPPFSPEKKAFVERVIGTMQRDLMVTLPGFSGHSVADRKRIQDQKDFSIRLGESTRDAFAVELTSEQLQQSLDSWAAGKYGQNVHSSLGMSPAAKAATSTETVRKPKDIHALDLLLAPIAGGDGFRHITKQGIRVDGREYMSADLLPYIGQRVLVRHDPQDLGTIHVFDEDDTFLGHGINAPLLGINPMHHAAELKAAQQETIAEKKKELAQVRKSLNRKDQADAILAMHSAKKITEFPRQAETYSTPALDAAARAVGKAPIEARSENESRKVTQLAERMRAQQEAPKELTGREKWIAKAISIEQRQEAGEDISGDELFWYSQQEGLAWFVAHQNDRARRALAKAAAADYVAKNETPGVGPSASQ